MNLESTMSPASTVSQPGTVLDVPPVEGTPTAAPSAGGYVILHTAPKSLQTRGVDAAVTAAGVAAGIGVAAGMWALGSLIVGLFSSSDTAS